MYQTIGIVRYSGCSGSATSYLVISAQTGNSSRPRSSRRGCRLPRPPAGRRGPPGRGSRPAGRRRAGARPRRGGLEDLVGVIKDQADVTQSSDAGLGANGGNADFDARVAEGALLGLTGLVVEVDLLVRAAGHAHPPASAAVLVDQDDAVLGALVDRARGAGGRTGGLRQCSQMRGR